MTYIVQPINSSADPIEVEADGVTCTDDGKIRFHDAESNLVAQFVNVNFWPKPADPA